MPSYSEREFARSMIEWVTTTYEWFNEIISETLVEIVLLTVATKRRWLSAGLSDIRCIICDCVIHMYHKVQLHVFWWIHVFTVSVFEWSDFDSRAWCMTIWVLFIDCLLLLDTLQLWDHSITYECQFHSTLYNTTQFKWDAWKWH
jgi:hypothetical protein